MRLTVAISLASLLAQAVAFAADSIHTVEINQVVNAPDEGLLLGNGDLSVSVYQSGDNLVFRLGKGDVWDRRLDFTDAAKPVTIREFIDGVLKYGWRTEDWSGSKTVASVTNDAVRFAEIFGQGTKPLGRPYPMPKPTGELRMRLPMDMPGPMTISQRLLIEEGRIFVDCSWTNGVRLKVEAVIPYDENVLAVRWAMKGWDDWTRVGNSDSSTPLRFILTRWADPSLASWSAALHASDGIATMASTAKKNSDAATLPAPTAFMQGNVGCIEQHFYPDNIFTDGFKYRLSLSSRSCYVSVPDVSYGTRDALVTASPNSTTLSGFLSVAVTTSRDASLDAPTAKSFAEYRDATVASAKVDWAKRGLSFPSDPALEQLWYATCHARRCILRGGTVPPGLYFPSTIGDYTYWNGDYHSNYNMQGIYWGLFNGNQLDQMQAYFDCVDFYRPIGEKIAHDYYGCRGCFIQLEGFPLRGDDDHHGTLPLGRMAYMTGWLMEPYWRWYRYTMDKEWLAQRGYPFIRDCALFYLDFLKKAPNADLPPELNDGKYHAFPSVHGESGWKTPMDLCDANQVMGHARFCLFTAILASNELDVDADLRAQWQDRLVNLAGNAHSLSSTLFPLPSLAAHCWLNAEPEFGGGVPKTIPEWDGTVCCPENGNGFSGQDYWYAGHNMMFQCASMRLGSFVPERDFPLWRKLVGKWARPNGLVRAMALAHYGHLGAWTESLCVMSSFEESLLQSWDGSIRLFPNWRGADISFENWRAEGAFRVSAAYKDGKVSSVRIVSEKGAPCVLSGDWTVANETNGVLSADHDEFGRLRFATEPGGVYGLTPVESPPPVVRSVSDDTRLALASGESLTAVTSVSSNDYPASVGAPLFWLDCAETNGWQFVDGTDQVLKVPSRAGSKSADVRYLSTSSDGGDWSGWNTVKPTPPTLVRNVSALNGGAMLDFGKKGSCQGLMFNPDPAMADAQHPGGYNALTNIGTVVTVWGSEHSGGHFLGGGVHSDYGWHRGQGFRTGGSFDFASALVNTHAQKTVRCGYGYFDGFRTGALMLGMNGGWQTLSLSCATATAESTGLGIADKRSNMYWVSGGQQVAEMLVYDRVLSDSEVAMVERYLERKWFSRGRPGWDGDARLGELKASSNNTTIPVDVPEGESLEIGFVAGGSLAQAKLVKTGGGALTFAGEGASHYAADIVVKEGSLKFPSEAGIPSAADLPHHLYARFDACESVVTDADGYVICWSNLVADARVAGQKSNGTMTDAFPFVLHAHGVAQRPSFISDAFGEGLPAIDFGAVALSDNGGRYLVVCTNQLASAESCGCAVPLRGVGTIVAALEPYVGGGNLVNMRSMMRRDPSTTSYRAPTMCHAISNSATFLGSDGDTWMDGVKWNPLDGYRLAGPQVAAFRTVGGDFSRLMCDPNGNWCGGSRIGELLVWDRTLTDEEMRKASAYLAAKWFRRHVPGYRRPDGAFAADDIQRLVADGPIEINVGTGRTVRIGHLKASANVVKTGDGVLCLGDTVFASGRSIVTKEGTVECALQRTCGTRPADGATMHLDATDTASMIMATGDYGEKTLRRWNDAERGIGLWSYESYRRPYLNEDVGAACNGLPVVDFGGFGSGPTGIGDAGEGRWMVFDRPLYSIRSVFAVVGFQRGGGFLFSNSSASPCNDVDDITFHAGFSKQTDGHYVFSGASGLFKGYGEQSVFKGGMFTNGVALAELNSPISTNGYFLLELHPSAAVQAAQIARDRNIVDRTGGFRVGELLIYERELTDSEKEGTRNYLMRKWLGKQDVPSVQTVQKTKGWDVAGSAGVATESDIAVAHIAGHGVFAKSGAGTLSVDDLSGFTGTVVVAGGELRVNGSDVTNASELVSGGIIYHADATQGISAKTNALGQVCVQEWASRVGGLTAVRSGGSANMQQLVYDPAVGFKPTVVMNGYNACFLWQDAEWSQVNLPGIRSVFWVIGSQEGGGFLLGGGTNATGTLTYYWHRGIHYPNWPNTKGAMVGTTNICHILHDGANKSLRQANWWLNGEQVEPRSTGLSGGWDLVSMVVADDECAVNADGLAFDGRSRSSTPEYPSGSNHGYNGHQRLAEVIVYNRRVTDGERVKIENYLRGKWLLGMHFGAEKVTLNVAAGAFVKLGGSQHYHSLVGTGTVCGDICLTKLVADAAATEWPTVDGSLTLADSIEIEVCNRPVGNKSPIRILTCGDIRGVDPASGLFVKDDGLYLQPKKVGTLLRLE